MIIININNKYYDVFITVSISLITIIKTIPNMKEGSDSDP